MSKENRYFDFKYVTNADKIVLPLHETAAKGALDVDKIIMVLAGTSNGPKSRENPARYIQPGHSFIEQPLLKNIFQRVAKDILASDDDTTKDLRVSLNTAGEDNWRQLATLAIDAIRTHRFNPPIKYRLDEHTQVNIAQFNHWVTRDAVNERNVEPLNIIINRVFEDWAAGKADEKIAAVAHILKNKIPPFFLVYILAHDVDLKDSFEEDYEPKNKNLTAVQTFELWSILYAKKLQGGQLKYQDDEIQLGFAKEPSTDESKSHAHKLYRLYSQVHGEDPRQN